jgi:hypothetical protein
MVVFRSNVIAENLVLFALPAKHRLNSSPVKAKSKPMFGLDLSRVGQLRRALNRLAQPGRQWVSFAFLTKDEVSCLTKLAERQPFRSASPEISYKSNRVVQDFDICFPAPRIEAFDHFAHFLERGLFQAGQMMIPSPFSTDFRFDDFAIQRYPPGSRGIGIHRDGSRYRHIVVIATLAGKSRLFSTPSRDGRKRRVIDDRPGRIVLLSAPAFAGRTGEAARPLHGVDHVQGGRLSLGLRVECQKK